MCDGLPYEKELFLEKPSHKLSEGRPETGHCGDYRRLRRGEAAQAMAVINHLIVGWPFGKASSTCRMQEESTTRNHLRA